MDREVDREGWYRKKDRRDLGKKKKKDKMKAKWIIIKTSPW